MHEMLANIVIHIISLCMLPLMMVITCCILLVTKYRNEYLCYKKVRSQLVGIKFKEEEKICSQLFGIFPATGSAWVQFEPIN